MEGFKSLSHEEQDKRFGANYAQAIRDGADIYQVVNSKRGMQRVGKGYTALTTSEGTTRYGWASMQYAQQSGRRMKRRLSIDGIYSLTGGDREKTIAALKANGYFVPEIRKSMWLHDNTYRQGRVELLTAAEKRVQTAKLRYEAVLEGRNPNDGRMPLTPEIAAQCEREYRRWVTSGGQIFQQ